MLADLRVALRSLAKAPTFTLTAVLTLALGIGANTAGLGGAAALSRFVARLLFGVGPLDPLTFSGVATLLLVVAATAISLPARRVTGVDPATTLRRTQ